MKEKTARMIDHLLNHPEPAIRLKTMVDVLGRSMEDPTVQDTQQELKQSLGYR